MGESMSESWQWRRGYADAIKEVIGAVERCGAEAGVLAVVEMFARYHESNGAVNQFLKARTLTNDHAPDPRGV